MHKGSWQISDHEPFCMNHLELAQVVYVLTLQRVATDIAMQHVWQ